MFSTRQRRGGRTQGCKLRGMSQPASIRFPLDLPRPSVSAAGNGLKGAFSRWNSRTRLLNAWTAAPTSCSPPGNNFFSTISNSRTNLSAARLASPNELRFSERRRHREPPRSKPRPSARNAGKKLPSPSNQRRGGRYFVANAFRLGDTRPQLKDFYVPGNWFEPQAPACRHAP